MRNHSGVPPAGGSAVGQVTLVFMYTVYAIYNERNQKIYIGQTVDLQIRLDQHNQGAFKGFTSRFDGLWVVIYSENMESRLDALKRERQLKSFQGRKFVRQYIPA